MPAHFIFAGEKWNNVINLWKKKEEEWFCFFQEANFHMIDKQLLI